MCKMWASQYNFYERVSLVVFYDDVCHFGNVFNLRLGSLGHPLIYSRRNRNGRS